MMVTKSGLSEFDDRLSILAQRLREHREAYPSHLEDEGMPPCHGSRSSTPWMAMPWRAPPWQGAGEWIGNVASMLSMRSTSSLRDQGQGDWTDQGNWPATRSGGASPRGTAARLQAIRDDREDLQWEADGNQGSHPGAQRRTGSDQCPSPSGREVGRSIDGIDGLRRDSEDKSYSKERPLPTSTRTRSSEE